MQHTKGFIAFLIATAALCGALVMVVEVLGSRVIGPFFGVSLFVWTSLITVTMVALAAGLTLGFIVQRFPAVWPSAVFVGLRVALRR
ncbi:MAG: hypothetical protein WAW75_00330 [Gallionella sp.]